MEVKDIIAFEGGLRPLITKQLENHSQEIMAMIFDYCIEHENVWKTNDKYTIAIHEKYLEIAKKNINARLKISLDNLHNVFYCCAYTIKGNKCKNTGKPYCHLHKKVKAQIFRKLCKYFPKDVAGLI
jgi:hypothetical protein